MEALKVSKPSPLPNCVTLTEEDRVVVSRVLALVEAFRMTGHLPSLAAAEAKVSSLIVDIHVRHAERA